jgi:hypothetical protein
MTVLRMFALCIAVVAADSASAEVVVSNPRILTPTVRPKIVGRATPALAVDVSSTNGVGYITVNVQGPNGMDETRVIDDFDNQPVIPNGVLRVSGPTLSAFAPPGTYSVYVMVCDLDPPSGSNCAGDGTAFQVANAGSVDSSAPALQSGELLNTAITRSPSARLRLRLSMTDVGAGVSRIGNLCITEQPNLRFICVVEHGYAPAVSFREPRVARTEQILFPLPSDIPAGEWKVSYISVLDGADNRSTYYNEQLDSVFPNGRTFVVQ